MIIPQLIAADRGQDAVLIHLVAKDGLDNFTSQLSPGQRSALSAQKFTAAVNQIAIIPDGDGWCVAAGVANPGDLSTYCLAAAAEKLPQGTYRIAPTASAPLKSTATGADTARVGAEGAGASSSKALLGWQIAQYRFTRYRKDTGQDGPRVLLTKDARAIAASIAEAKAITLVRDLVNTPAADMGPAALEKEAERIAQDNGAKLEVTSGELLAKDYPMVHAVGRAAARHHAPRLLHLSWGDPTKPVLALVGKGVCFDSGGLDIKPAAGMLLMKKDMGGAAHALALAELVMASKLPVRLHCLVPAVENAISADAFRPGDILHSRQGLTVEIGNTDAEGRLILGDALTRASEEKPDLLIDFATLTGAARVALGPDLPALFTRRDETADALLRAGKQTDDECWRLPMPQSYNDWLKSDVADLNNSPASGFAGASVAALFLNRFVGEGIDWAHFDTFAWNPTARPGKPKGGAALGLLAAWQMLKDRYGAKI